MTKPTGGSWQESVLYSFSGPSRSYPRASLVLGSAGALYGTTHSSTTSGTVFELAPPSVAGGVWTETVLYAFAGGGGNILDGAVLIGPGGTLFTTTQGNTTPGGTAVALAPPTAPGGSWTQSVIYSFAHGGPGPGTSPYAGLVSEGAALYGTDYYGGDDYCSPSGCGVVYELTPPATSGGAWTPTTLHMFTGWPGDGASPLDALTVGPGGVLYGTTYIGGTGSPTSCGPNGPGCGTVFQLTPPTAPGGAWTESIIYTFTGENGDGALPSGSVALGKNGEIYGTTSYGGSATSGSPCSSGAISGCGTVFELTPPPTPGGAWTETVLHSFTGQDGDGAIPLAVSLSVPQARSTAPRPPAARERAPYSPSCRSAGAPRLSGARNKSLPCRQLGSTVNSIIHSGTDPASKQTAKHKRLLTAKKTPNAATIAAMEAARRGEVKETSLAELARIWEGAFAKSSGRRSSPKP